MRKRNKQQVLLGKQAHFQTMYRKRHGAELTERNRLYGKKRRQNHVYRQMENDCRRLGISNAEWRRQVEQGVITINGR